MNWIVLLFVVLMAVPSSAQLISKQTSLDSIVVRKVSTTQAQPEVAQEDVFEFPQYQKMTSKSGEKVDVQVGSQRLTRSQLEKQIEELQAKLDAMDSAK